MWVFIQLSIVYLLSITHCPISFPHHLPFRSIANPFSRSNPFCLPAVYTAQRGAQPPSPPIPLHLIASQAHCPHTLFDFIKQTLKSQLTRSTALKRSLQTHHPGYLFFSSLSFAASFSHYTFTSKSTKTAPNKYRMSEWECRLNCSHSRYVC